MLNNYLLQLSSIFINQFNWIITFYNISNYQYIWQSWFWCV